jgi:putative glutathione S-transferase
VPVLWDRVRGRIVNNESSEIIRMLDSEFDAFAAHPELHFLPADLRAEIDELNAFVYENVNDGVYRTGFARTQAAYERAFVRLFDALDELDARLASSRYLMGSTITEADWRLFPTLLRFDPVYVGHFKCNLRRVIDYPQLSGYLRDLYQHPGIAQTVDMDHIKRHYYRTHPTLNPRRIVPVGPALDLAAPHGRDNLAAYKGV